MPLPRISPPRNVRPGRSKAAIWVDLERRLEELEGTWCEGEVLNLPGWRTIRYRETDEDIIVLAELTAEAPRTCACETASEIRRWGYTEPSYVRDIPIRCKRTRIYYRLERQRCMKCRDTIQQPLTGLRDQGEPDAGHKRSKLTARLVEYVGRESLSISRTFSDVADEVGCGELTVRNIYTARANGLWRDRVIETPRWLAIDEVHPKDKKIVHCVISDPEKRQVLDLLPTNSQRNLIPWLIQLPNPERIEVVTIDMCPAYKEAVNKVLAGAQIIVDRYHVHNLLNVALKGVMEVIRASMTASEQRKYMRPEYLLLKNARKLTKKRKKDKGGNEYPSEQEALKKWLEDVPDLKMAHGLKKDFSDILQLSDRQKAETLTDPWIMRVIEFVEYFRAKYMKRHEGKWEDPFGNIPNTFSDWRVHILNYVEYKDRFGLKPTNGFAECANGLIKKAFRLGNGYSYEVLRTKVVLGGILVNKRPPHPLDTKRTRQKWDRDARQKRNDQGQVNPHSNLALLAKVMEEQDKTRDLLPKPQESPDWSKRFESLVQNEYISVADRRYMNMLEPVEPKEKEVVRRGRRAFRFKAGQLKMF